MPIYRLGSHTPQIASETYIANNATLIGQVHIQQGASVWFGAVLRGDNEPIIVGENSNIQENSVLHTDINSPSNIGTYVTIGHNATLHGCHIGDNCLIGMGAIVLNNAVIGPNSVVGAGALITENKIFPEGVLIIGSPAKIARLLTPDEIAQLPLSAQHYKARGQDYAQNLTLI